MAKKKSKIKTVVKKVIDVVLFKKEPVTQLDILQKAISVLMPSLEAILDKIKNCEANVDKEDIEALYRAYRVLNGITLQK